LAFSALSPQIFQHTIAQHRIGQQLDLSWFDVAPLIAFTVTKETDYGT